MHRVLLSVALLLAVEGPAAAQHVVMLDDFENIQRSVAFSIARKQWTLTGAPLVLRNGAAVSLDEADRGKLIWYNPHEQIRIRDVFPYLEINSRTGQLIEGLVLDRRFNHSSRPGHVPDDR